MALRPRLRGLFAAALAPACPPAARPTLCGRPSRRCCTPRRVPLSTSRRGRPSTAAADATGPLITGRDALPAAGGLGLRRARCPRARVRSPGRLPAAWRAAARLQYLPAVPACSAKLTVTCEAVCECRSGHGSPPNCLSGPVSIRGLEIALGDCRSRRGALACPGYLSHHQIRMACGPHQDIVGATGEESSVVLAELSRDVTDSHLGPPRAHATAPQRACRTSAARRQQSPRWLGARRLSHSGPPGVSSRRRSTFSRFTPRIPWDNLDASRTVFRRAPLQ